MKGVAVAIVAGVLVLGAVMATPEESPATPPTPAITPKSPAECEQWRREDLYPSGCPDRPTPVDGDAVATSVPAPASGIAGAPSTSPTPGPHVDVDVDRHDDGESWFCRRRWYC